MGVSKDGVPKYEEGGGGSKKKALSTTAVCFSAWSTDEVRRVSTEYLGRTNTEFIGGVSTEHHLGWGEYAVPWIG